MSATLDGLAAVIGAASREAHRRCMVGYDGTFDRYITKAVMDHLAASPDATIIVTYGNKAEVITLSGGELSQVDLGHGQINRYLSNASRSHIADEVEKALLRLTKEQ